MADPMDIIGEVSLSCGPVFGSSLADFEPDGDVDINDLIFMAEHWMEDSSIADIEPSGGDGVVNLRDFSVLTRHWLEGTTP